LRLWKTVELPDGNLVSIGATQQGSVLIKTDRSGKLLTTKSLGNGFPNDLQLAGAMYVVVGANIMRINPDLTVAWTMTTAARDNVKRVRPLSNGNLLALSEDNLSRVSMNTINAQNGALLSRKVVIDSFVVTRLPEFTVLKNNVYALVEDAVWKFNLDGNLVAKLPFGLENLFDISTAADQTLLVSRGESILFKIDTLGRQIWRNDIWHKSWSNTNNNGILVVNELNPGWSSGEISLLDGNGKLVWIRPIGENRQELPFQPRGSIQTKEGNFLIVGNTFLPADSFRTVRSRAVKLSNDNKMYINRIIGNVYIDYNNNCKKDPEDITRPKAFISAEAENGNAYWGMSDSLGRYSIRCDTGNYKLSIAKFTAQKNWNWVDCFTETKRLVGVGKTDTVNFFQTLMDSSGRIICAALNVNIGIGLTRRCQNSNVTIAYNNIGSTTARNVVIAVQLDTVLDYLNASIPLSNRIGNKYFFNIADLAVNSSGRFYISTYVKCGTQPFTWPITGQAVCVKAQIFADTTCPNSQNWSGADLAVEGKCQQDSVIFTIKNIGTATSQRRNMVVIENNIISSIGPVQLARQTSTTRSFPANGNTWRLTVEQEPYHPNSTAPSAFVEGCANSAQSIALGYANNFANDDAALSIATACSAIITSCDPNDKTGYPLGYGDKHYIDQNQDIDYTIRFQNTGNDTAFKVVIRDTIDTRYLDLGSIEFGVSSHQYEPTLYDKNIVQFTFDNILLVDSFKNEPASNGYVKFRIKQKKDVALGTKINNSAAIYFDYNAPVITNMAQHTVGKPILLTTKIGEISASDVAVTLSPNPFNEQTVFKIGEKGPLSINGIFELFDINGHLLRQADFSKNEFILHRNDLPTGIYIFKIKTMDGRFSSGKVVIQ
jgi:uncharacterized repeat protein (TIGR01451 family)